MTEHPEATHDQIAEIVGIDRSTVQRALSQECPTKSEPNLLNHGGKRTEQGDYNPVDSRGSTGKEYIVARLKRDGRQEVEDHDSAQLPFQRLSVVIIAGLPHNKQESVNCRVGSRR